MASQDIEQMRRAMDESAMPTVFVSHGVPMVALQSEDAYAKTLGRFFGALPKPKAIVAVSSGWQSAGPVQITLGPKLKALHDYKGFPEELYDIRYQPPGSPELSVEVAGLLGEEGFSSILNPDRGMDFGAWLPLRIGFPGADVPVVQISLPLDAGPAEALRMGRGLRALRQKGVLLVGSGGAVKNLSRIRWWAKDGPPAPFAREFNEWLLARLERGKVAELVQFDTDAPGVEEAHPTAENLLPLFFTLGSSLSEDRFRLIFDGYQYFSLSMMSFCLA